MATTSTKKSLALAGFPFLVGGIYFGYSYYYKKRDFNSSAGVAALLFLCASLPWFTANANAPALTASGAAGVGDKTADNQLDSSSAHLNTMDSAGRKAAIDYIVAQNEKFDSIAKYIVAPPTREKRIAAYNALTNDELKVLYCVYKFQEDKDNLIKKYGTTSSDVLAKRAAKETYGIDLSGVDNVEKMASVAITKYNAALGKK